MNTHTVLRVWTLAAMWVAGLPPGSATAAPPSCQARAEYITYAPPIEVAFQALTDGGNLPLTFHWDFGDGETSSEQNPSHFYDASGFFQAILTVTGAGEPAESCIDTARIHPGLAVDPICLATVSSRWSEDATALQFTVNAVFGGEPGATWTWRFGDGSTSTEQNPMHPYAVPGTYWAAATMHDSHGDFDCLPMPLRITTLVAQNTGVGPGGPAGGLRLETAQPNPFQAATALGFTLPRSGLVRLSVYDPSGRRVARLVDEARTAGPHVAMWQGRASDGRLTPAGLYFAVLEHEGATRSTRIIRLP